MPSSSIVVKLGVRVYAQLLVVKKINSCIPSFNVKYGKTLKRFRVGIQNNKLCIDISTLKEKIRSLFSIAAGVDFTLTYNDEDNEEINLSADGELDDVVEQALNPLYITVNCELTKKPIPNSVPISNFGAAQMLNSSTLYPQSQTVNPPITQWQQQINTQTALSGAWYSQLVQKVTADVIRQLRSNTGFYFNAGASVQPTPFGSVNVNGQTLNTPHSQTLKPAVYGQTLNIPHSQTVNPVIYPQSLNLPHSQTVNSAVYGQTLNTPHPYLYPFPNFGAGVTQQQNLNPGFTFKSGASTQPMTCGLSNVDGQQSGSKNSKYQFKLYSELIDDVTVPDGTIMAPFSKVTKIWKLRNNGTIAWPHGSKLVWIAGDVLTKDLTVDVKIPTDGLPVNAEIDIAIDIIAPGVPGRYFSCWRMVSLSGEFFGKFVSVSFQVVEASMKVIGETSTNVSLPPVVKNVEVVNKETDSGNKLVSGSDSMFDFKEVKTALESARVEVSSDDKEQALLNDLEKMGFKQLDLNKEILKKNNYDLEKSIDDLCGVSSEWDQWRS
ncbi:protein NBR1 homolog [Rutidosis leptorrhynchoides]|uniref:protein NBR1 homolog n=1 Tax=Rutidosis leptorrhynchoides TaxID=125765 RepID=UPI003A9A1FB6